MNSAVATLEPFGDTPVRGKVRFVSSGSKVEILADVYGLDEGWYRMIIRRYGDTSNLQQGSAGPVFNAINVPRVLAGEDRLQRLSGDLGMFQRLGPADSRRSSRKRRTCRYPDRSQSWAARS